MIDAVVDLVRSAEVDLVLIAGDLYDRAIPNADAVMLLDDALCSLRGAGARVVAIAGNHDSGVRVGWGERVMAPGGVVVRGDPARGVEPIQIPCDDGGPPVVVHAVPYLEPMVARRLFPAEEPSSGREADGSMVAAAAIASAISAAVGGPSSDGCAHDDDPFLGRLFDDEGRPTPATRPSLHGEPRGVPVGVPVTHESILRRVLDGSRAQAASIPVQRSIVLAHAFVAGGHPSDSERELAVGGADRVSLRCFEGFGYVALGHLHRSQVLGGGHVRYSGSPLAYSFSESEAKGCWIVDLPVSGPISAEFAPLGVGRSVRTIEGSFEQLLTDPALTSAHDDWVRILLTDPIVPAGAMAGLQRRFSRAVLLVHRPPTGRPLGRDAVAERIRGRSDHELVEAFLAETLGSEPSEDDRLVVKHAIAGTEHDPCDP